MSRLRGLWQRVRSVSARSWAFGALALVIGLAVLVGILYGWDYTNSSPFCGTACHTMPPHYQSFLRSPHARVQCVECHIGRTFIGVTFTRKANDAQYVINYLTQNYKYPIYATNMQPAREACEKCHWPDKFSSDKVVTLTDFGLDKQNTPVQTTLVLKTGGGTQREGLGKGIHWHTQSVIEFAYSDDQKQEIPYIQVTNADGTKTTYTDVDSKLTPQEIAQLPTRRMDCIDCHNRVSHNFLSPADSLDTSLSNKQIDATIPEIKKKGVEVLTPQYPSNDAANKVIADLETFYQQTYPDYYTKNAATIKAAIAQLQSSYTELHYPEQGLDWTVHPDDLGHENWPGCFRCHDGKHFTSDYKQAIRLECNLCHSIPEISTPGGPAPVLSLSQPDEPDSHKTTTWIAEHRTAFNSSCQACHDTNNAGGNDNSSFCSNSACHGTQWKFVGLDAPGLAKIFPAPALPKGDPNATPPQVPHPIGGAPNCQICHGPGTKVRPFPADHVGRTNDVCLACHKPTIPPPSTAAAPGGSQPNPAGGPPSIPHDTAGRTQCLGCHGTGVAGVPQVPQFHVDYGFTNNNCLTCHKSSAGAAKPAAAPTVPAPTVAAPTSAPAAPAPTNTPTVAAPTSAPTVSAPTSAPTVPAATSVATVAAPTVAAATSAPAASAPTNTPTVAAPTSQPTVAPTAAPAAGGPPRLPASHVGRTAGCTACHSTGVGGAPKFPTDHAGRTDDTCKVCHLGP